MSGGGDLRVVAPARPHAFITRAPLADRARPDAAGPRRRRTDRDPSPAADDELAPSRGLLIWPLVGLALWVALLYLVRFIVR